jgi:hypothetical protein
MELFASLFLLLFIFFGFILFLFVLIDVIRHEFTAYNKIIWIIVIICFPILGPILYLVFGRSQRVIK